MFPLVHKLCLVVSYLFDASGSQKRYLVATPWKFNGWNLKITQLKSGKSSVHHPPTHDFGFHPFIFHEKLNSSQLEVQLPARSMSHLHWPFSLQLISHAKERVQHVQLQRLRQHDPKRQVLATVFWGLLYVLVGLVSTFSSEMFFFHNKKTGRLVRIPSNTP